MRMSLEKEGLEMPEVLVTLELTGGQPYPYEGKFENWSTSSQQSSGMIGGRVRMPNPDGLLLPGHNVIIKGKALQPVTRVMIPQKSVFQDQQGHYVMVLDADDVVQRKNINVGVRDGLDWAVQSGLEEGVRVIVEGAGKLRPGTQVTLAKQP
jgi:membrane fusion protein (multidrug efflux system)